MSAFPVADVGAGKRILKAAGPQATIADIRSGGLVGLGRIGHLHRGRCAGSGDVKRDPRVLVAVVTSVSSLFLMFHGLRMAFIRNLDWERNGSPCESFARQNDGPTPFCSPLDTGTTEEMLSVYGSLLLMLITVSLLAWVWFKPIK
jgi:hypothetical protein